MSHARNRLNRLLVNLNKDEDLKDEYKIIFDLYVNLEIIEQVPDDEIVCGNTVYYMPHRPVISPTSISTKLRPVFDASAMGPSGVS